VCGIAGTVGAGPPDPLLLQRMAAMMAKRGPDGQGVWRDEKAGLAFRRLAIIDLHERSTQPMHLDNLHLAFNGEIYNYLELRDTLRGLGREFRTEGDAEVLLHAWAEWGDAALERLNGMFAFAVWDDRARRLTLCTDPFGEKPVYYTLAPTGRVVFGSEIKAILQDPDVEARADGSALRAYIAHNVVPPVQRSYFAGIHRLPGGHLLRLENSRATVERWWRPRRVEVPAARDEAARELGALLLDAIRLRLRSDVPVGTSLSGGLDSSMVVMLSAELAGDHRRHAFTARFPGFERDEWGYASEVARAAGVVEHHAVEPRPEEVLADLEGLVLDHEEPVGSLSVYAQWRVNATARDAGVVVLLDGQGADELFGGYAIAAGFAMRSAGPAAALRELRAGGAEAGRQLALALGSELLPGPLRRAYRRRAAAAYAAPELAGDASLGEPAAPEAWIADESDPLRRELLREAFVTSLPQLLRYADRSSMAQSREVRLPFLDRRIADFALSVPAAWLRSAGTSKALLRDAGRGVVPDAVLARRDKVGFEPPQARWLRVPGFRARIGEVLLDPAARERGLYDSAAIEDDLAAGAWRDPGAIWRALNAELWLRELVEAPLPEPVVAAA
jgi:asparagine synthase (glutamine-hydrolysing)